MLVSVSLFIETSGLFRLSGGIGPSGGTRSSQLSSPYHTGARRRLMRLPSEPLASILSSVIKRVFSFFQSSMCK